METVVETARRALGPVGVFLPFSIASAPSADEQRAAARRIEGAGYRAAWTNEAVGGKDALVQLAVLLAATGRLVLGTSIANIWARAPQTAHGAAALLAQAFPGRFVLGLGVGYPQQAASVGREFGRPVATMRAYLEQMTAPGPFPAQRVTGRLAMPGTYRATLARAGFAEREIAEVSERLVDAVVAHGSGAAIAAKVAEHLAAGADHVLLMPAANDAAAGVGELERLAPALGLDG